MFFPPSLAEMPTVLVSPYFVTGELPKYGITAAKHLLLYGRKKKYN